MKSFKSLILPASAALFMSVSFDALAGRNAASACWWDGYLDQHWKQAGCSAARAESRCRNFARQRSTANRNHAQGIRGGIHSYCRTESNRNRGGLDRHYQNGKKKAKSEDIGRIIPQIPTDSRGGACIGTPGSSTCD